MKSLKIFFCLCTLVFLIGLSFEPGKLYAAEFPGTELLGRPTDTSVTINVVANAVLQAYFEYGTTSGDYTHSTDTITSYANEPIEVVIDGLTANTKYY